MNDGVEGGRSCPRDDRSQGSWRDADAEKSVIWSLKGALEDTYVWGRKKWMVGAGKMALKRHDVSLVPRTHAGEHSPSPQISRQGTKIFIERRCPTSLQAPWQCFPQNPWAFLFFPPQLAISYGQEIHTMTFWCTYQLSTTWSYLRRFNRLIM